MDSLPVENAVVACLIGLWLGLLHFMLYKDDEFGARQKCQPGLTANPCMGTQPIAPAVICGRCGRCLFWCPRRAIDTCVYSPKGPFIIYGPRTGMGGDFEERRHLFLASCRGGTYFWHKKLKKSCETHFYIVVILVVK